MNPLATVIQNLTPHTVNIYSEEGALLMSVEPLYKTKPARVAAKPNKVGAKICFGNECGQLVEVPFFEVAYGEVENLPDETPGYILIVSGMVRAAVPHRLDVVSPGEAIRDDKGNVVGCIGLYSNHPLAHLFQ